MKRNNKFIYVLFSLLLLCSSCTDVQDGMETTVSDKQVKSVVLMITSRPLQTSGTTTRSEGKGMDVILGDSGEIVTRAVVEDKIDNLCVFQFEGTKEASGAVLKAKTYFSDLKDKTLIVNLKPSTSGFFYVCANVGDITKDFTVDSSTFQNLIDASYAISKGHDSFSSSLPMSGCSDVFNTATLSGSLAITLTRMVAKVTFVCDLSALPAGATFTITGAKLRNVPKKIKYYGVNGNSDANVDTYIGAPTVVGKTTTYTWFMPENKGGTPQHSVAKWTDRYMKNAPLYATYIELTGDYITGEGDIYMATYVVYLGNGTDMNNYDVERNHYYKVTSKIKGVNTADQRVAIETDLSADGLANCYLAGKDNHWYRFNGLVMGNGNSKDYASTIYPGLKILPLSGINITGVAKAFVLWETAEGLIKEVKWDAASGCVKFKTGEAKGNALIAVANNQHEVLWSWHIWRTNNVNLATLNARYALNIQTNTNRKWYTDLKGVGADKGRVRSLVLMDRDLGSAFDGELDIEDCKGANCLHYQFGRKDPFPAGRVYQPTEAQVNGDVLLYGYSRDGEKVSFTILDKELPAPGVSAMSTILNSIKYPEVFYISPGYNWITTIETSIDDWRISNSLWGDENNVGGTISDGFMDGYFWDGQKTIYDPSPAGWRVAPADVWTGIIKEDIGSWAAIPSANIYKLNTWISGPPWGHIVYFNGDAGVTTFIPASSYRNGRDGTLYNAGTGGYGWFSSPGGQDSKGGSSLHIYYDLLYVAFNGLLGHGFPVRCVKE